MRTAIVGLGRMGRRHLEVVRRLGLEVVAVCDVRGDVVAETLASEGLPAQYGYTDLADLLHECRPECLVVATTADAHCEAVCAAAGAGVEAILCEKPMAVSLAQCDRMIDVCEQHGARLAVNHQMRFMEQYTYPKQICSSEVFGGVRSVTVVAGNFGISMNGTHYFEMFRYLTDEPPNEVEAWFAPDVVANPRGAQFEDRAGAVRITTEGGRRFYLDAGSDQGHGVTVVYAGPYGQLVVDELDGRMRLVVREEAHRTEPTSRYGMPATETEQRIAAADSVGPSAAVLDALVRGDDYPTGEDGRLAVAALVAAHVSDGNAHVPVRVDGELPREQVFPWA
jgi:predicted dehydrogenase